MKISDINPAQKHGVNNMESFLHGRAIFLSTNFIHKFSVDQGIFTHDEISFCTKFPLGSIEEEDFVVPESC